MNLNPNFQKKGPVSPRQSRGGQAALIAVLFMMSIMLSAIFGVVGLSLKEARVAVKNYSSRNSFFAAEAGIDDAVYRLNRGKNLSSSYSISLNGASADIEVTSNAPNERTIISSGDSTGANRSLSANLLTGTENVSFFYGVQVGDGGLEMGNNSIVNGNVYSNGDIKGNNGASISGDVVVAGGITTSPTVEWATQNSDQNFATASANRDIAQSFTATQSGNLNRVSIYLGKVGTPTGDITVRIASDSGGNPATSGLASATITNSLVGLTPSWINVSFSVPANLTNGNKYWIILDYGSNSSSNYWNWRKDNTDAYAGNTGKYSSSWSGGGGWTAVGGDLAFRAWIGGVNTKIENITIGNSTSGTGRANVFISSTIHGSACPNQYCVIDNPAREELPISNGVIQDWRDAAIAGGTCVAPICDSSGNLNLTNGATLSLGPKVITGDLILSNNAILTVTGTIYVMGGIDLSNGCIVRLAASYGSNSGVILTDGPVDVSNNCAFSGSGTAGSYIMLLSDKDSVSGNAFDISNNALGVIYYASRGWIHFSNNAIANEATGYGIRIDNNATITYESGLANVNFSSGPAGGWDIRSWKEIIP